MPSLLLVEDSEELAENLAEILNGADYDTAVVHSAEQALHAIERRTFDGIITDLRLPKQTGIDLLQSLRQNRVQTPVILMTAYADETASRSAEALGAVAVLIKPLDFARLFLLLDRLPRNLCATPQ